MNDFITTLIASLSNPWVIFGFFAQFIFFLRFIVQWIASERRKRVVIPTAFWYLSIVGTILILIYATYRRDIVFMTASTLSLFIYVRNIMLKNGEKAVKEALPS